MAVAKKKLSKIRALLTQAHTLHNQHKYEQAAKLYEKLLKIAPRHPDALNLLGLLRYQQGRLEEAGKLLERAIQVDPNHKQAWLNYGNLRQQLRDLDGAIEAFQQVLRVDPNSSFALLNLGNCMRLLSRYDEADSFYLRALVSDPTLSLAWANLGKLARTKGQWERAMKTADAALDCPDPAPLGLCLWIEVHHLTKPSAELAQRAEELLTHPGLTGELLAEGQFFAHHIYGLDPQVLLRARDRVQQQIAATVEPGVSDTCPPPRAEPRALGFISSAFRQHPVAFMALGALEHLRQQGFRICIYDGSPQDDAYARRFRACADVWHDISQMSDIEVVELMRADGVDVLFDMSGVTNHGRPRIPAMRAAPLQIKWVGGQSGPSGIPNMDAFLTDAVQSPPGADADHHERLLRMPHGYVTYTPPIDAPEPAAEPPVKRNGFITFGSLNKLAKLSTELLQVWAQILRAVPNSRLLLRAEGANEQVIQNAVAKVMEANGISRERLSYEGPADHREFLDTYSRIDIALDSFPYTGGLTTCEAMWMGVPVVALAGRFFCERHAATHLHNVGLGEWVASNTEEYIAKAIALAKDHEKLAHFRTELRDKVRQSPLCEYQGFAADLAKLVRQEWASHVADETAGEGQEQDPAPDPSALQHEGETTELVDAEQASVAAAAITLPPADIAAKVEQACELAERLLLDDQPQKALELCQTVARLDPKNPKVLFLLGLAQAMSGDAKAAVKPILEALNLEPRNEAWWRHAADVFAAADHPQDAEYARDRAAAIQVARLAEQLKDAAPKKLASTIDECESALRDNPSDVVAFFVLTHALLAQESATSQQPALESALREVGWLDKLPLYAYWVDYIEHANHVEMPRISVIVISNEPEDNTPEAMRRLREQVGSKGEVIFVNNGCNDEVFDSIRPYADIYIRLKANSGAYCARNIGAIFGRGNILLFVEDDGVPENGFIQAHLQIHEDYDVIAVRGVYQPSTGSGAPPHYKLGDEPFAAPCNLEGNASYQAQEFYKVGGWADWILFGHGGVELASRLLELVPVPEKQIYHPGPVLRHDYFLSEEHLRVKHQRQNVSWHLISAHRTSWDTEFWRWEPEHRGPLRRRQEGKAPTLLSRFQEACEFHESKEFIKALLLCLSLVEEDVNFDQAWHLAGVVSAKLGEIDTAEQLVRRAIKIRPSVADYQNTLRYVLCRRGALKGAEKEFRAALVVCPDNEDAKESLLAQSDAVSKAQHVTESPLKKIVDSQKREILIAGRSVDEPCAAHYMPKAFTWLLSYLGQALDIEKINHDSFGLWPLVRIYLMQRRHAIVFSGGGLKKLRGRTESELSNPFDNPFEAGGEISSIGDASRREVLFMTRGEEHLPVSKGGPLLHRHFDPLIAALPGEVRGRKIHLGKLDLPEAHHIPPEVFVGSTLPNRGLSISSAFVKDLNACLRDYGTEFRVDVRDLSDWISQIFAIASTFEGSISLASVRAAFVRCYYTPVWLGLSIAAKKAGAVLIDVQHGKAGPYHPAYTHWTGIGGNKYDVLPDLFWLWGPPWDACVQTGELASRPGNILCAGDPWESYSRDFVDQNDVAALTTKVAPYDHVVLVSLTWVKDFPGYFKDAVRRTAGKVFWLVRAHPVDPTEGEEIRSWAIGRNISNIEMAITSRMPLPQVLQYADCHVTTYSSVAYDAAAVGLRTVFLSEAGFDAMPDLVSSNMAWFAPNSDELVQGVMNSKSGGSGYAWKNSSVSFEHMQGVMKSVFGLSKGIT